MRRKKDKKEKKGKKEKGRAEPVELCDLCATTFPADRAVRGYVPDSSSVSRTNDWFDGLRLIVTCGQEHLALMRQIYRSRPFVQEELWAAKITRALTTGPSVLTLADLGCRTGLHEPEIRRAIAWHNAHLVPRDTP